MLVYFCPPLSAVVSPRQPSGFVYNSSDRRDNTKMRPLQNRFCVVCVCLSLTLATGLAQAPKRINRAIELLAQGQPIYYTGGHEGIAGSNAFEEGKKMAQTWADYINYDMEHAPFDVAALAEFMKGLAAGGPTKSGHRTPAVVITLPIDGSDEATMRANA